MPDQVTNKANVLETLQDLTRTLRDSEEGYRHAAQNVSDQQFKQEFDRLYRERSRQADQLDQIVRRMGGQPATRDGSTIGQIHRSFTDLRAALSRDDRAAVISEVARGEAYAKSEFDKALREALPDDVRRTVQELHDAVRTSRNRFRDLSNQFGSGSRVIGSIGYSIADTSRKSYEGVSHYVEQQPVTGAAIALGIGFLIGFLAGVSTVGGGRSRHSRSWR